MLATRIGIRNTLRASKLTQVRSVSTLEGRPYIVSPWFVSTTLLRFSYSRLFYYIVCFPQRSSQWQKSCSLPPAVAADQSKFSHWNCIATPANSRDVQREPGIPQNPARSYFETCTRRPGQHLPGPGHDFHIRG